jgi:hypothetical protein
MTMPEYIQVQEGEIYKDPLEKYINVKGLIYIS